MELHSNNQLEQHLISVQQHAQVYESISRISTKNTYWLHIKSYLNQNHLHIHLYTHTHTLTHTHTHTYRHKISSFAVLLHCKEERVFKVAINYTSTLHKFV